MSLETEELIKAVRSGVITRATLFTDSGKTVFAWTNEKKLDEDGLPVVESVAIESASDAQAFMQLGVRCSIDGPEKHDCKFDTYIVNGQEILK